MMNTDELLEILAEKQHEIWVAWMKFMFENGGASDGYDHWTMWRDKRDRWLRQMATPYAELSEKEKQSDRDVLTKFGIDKLIKEMDI